MIEWNRLLRLMIVGNRNEKRVKNIKKYIWLKPASSLSVSFKVKTVDRDDN